MPLVGVGFQCSFRISPGFITINPPDIVLDARNSSAVARRENSAVEMVR